MKKIFTLIAFTFLTVAVFAADRRPVITLKSNRNYEIVIDGRSYFSNNGIMNLSGIRNGQHSIKVYEMNRSHFRKFKKLVSASSFKVRNRDLDIRVDYRGQISISEERHGRDKWDDRRDNDGDFDYDHDQDNHDRDSRDRDSDKNERNNRF